jgi:small-conductance mechanosensitive channel
VGVHYKSDIHHVMKLCVEAALETPRILHDPKPNCLLRGFGDSSVDFEMRFWIEDPMNGRANVTSDMLVRIWDKFKEHGIEIPYPQRDLHLRTSDIGKLND